MFKIRVSASACRVGREKKTAANDGRCGWQCPEMDKANRSKQKTDNGPTNYGAAWDYYNGAVPICIKVAAKTQNTTVPRFSQTFIRVSFGAATWH